MWSQKRLSAGRRQTEKKVECVERATMSAGERRKSAWSANRTMSWSRWKKREKPSCGDDGTQR